MATLRGPLVLENRSQNHVIMRIFLSELRVLLPLLVLPLEAPTNDTFFRSRVSGVFLDFVVDMLTVLGHRQLRLNVTVKENSIVRDGLLTVFLILKRLGLHLASCKRHLVECPSSIVAC